MDSLPEISPQGENIEIPSGWIFSERGDPYFRVTQLNIGQRFIAGALSSSQEKVEYFFNSAGRPSQERIISSLGKYAYIFDWTVGSPESPESPIVMYWLFEKKPAEQSQSRDLHVEFTYPDRRNGEIRSIASPSDLIVFSHDGRLRRVLLAKTLSMGEDAIDAPPISVYSNDFGKTLATADWDFSLYATSPYFRLSKKEEPNTAIFSDEKGEAFRVEVKVGREKDRDGNEVAVLEVVESHIPTGHIKVVQVPLTIDLKKITDIFLGQDYFMERLAGEDILRAPWLDIGKMIGARVSRTRQQKV